jgi:hypothetical protein
VKTPFKLKINIKRDPLNFKSIQWNHLQAFPIWWDYPFKEGSVMKNWRVFCGRVSQNSQDYKIVDRSKLKQNFLNIGHVAAPAPTLVLKVELSIYCTHIVAETIRNPICGSGFDLETRHGRLCKNVRNKVYTFFSYHNYMTELQKNISENCFNFCS